MIEKNIFQSWFTKDLNETLRSIIDRFKDLNKDYNYYLYDDNDMDNFVNTHYPGEISDCYNKLNIIVAKVDFWRYLVLYKYGGVYLDMDSCINLPLNNLIEDKDEAIITAEGNPGLYVQWALIFRKGHPILKKVIELIVDNIKTNKYPNDIIKMTGPFIYTEAINQIHKENFGNAIDHSSISNDTDVSYTSNDLTYRIYGKDYNGYFSFRYNNSYNILYSNKIHWRTESRIKQLLK